MQGVPKKITWLLTVGSFMAVIAMIGFLLPALVQAPRGSAPPMMVVILVSLLVAVGIWAVYMRPKEVLGEPPHWPSEQQFQTRTILTMAFSELPVILSWIFVKRGTFVTMHYLVTGVALGILALLVIPTGLLFWKHREESEAEDALER